MFGFRDNLCSTPESNYFIKFICSLNPQWPQETIKNFYFCLNEDFSKAIDTKNVINDKVYNSFFPLYNYTYVKPVK